MLSINIINHTHTHGFKDTHPMVQCPPSIEELTAQRCAKALEEDRKDALRELDRYEHEPITFNAGERITDLVRFWEASLTFPSHKEGAKVNFSAWKNFIYCFSALLWMSRQLRHPLCHANEYFHPAKKHAHSAEVDSQVFLQTGKAIFHQGFDCKRGRLSNFWACNTKSCRGTDSYGEVWQACRSITKRRW